MNKEPICALGSIVLTGIPVFIGWLIGQFIPTAVIDMIFSPFPIWFVLVASLAALSLGGWRLVCHAKNLYRECLAEKRSAARSAS